MKHVVWLGKKSHAKVTGCENAASSQRHRTLQPLANALMTSASLLMPPSFFFFSFPFFSPFLSISLPFTCPILRLEEKVAPPSKIASIYGQWHVPVQPHVLALRISANLTHYFIHSAQIFFGSLYVSDFDRLHFSSLGLLQHLCLCEKMRQDRLILIYAALSLAIAFQTKSLLSLKSNLTLQKMWLWNKTTWGNSISKRILKVTRQTSNLFSKSSILKNMSDWFFLYILTIATAIVSQSCDFHCFSF